MLYRFARHAGRPVTREPETDRRVTKRTLGKDDLQETYKYLL